MIQDIFDCLAVSPREMDTLWAEGFRHFGTRFFRYDTAMDGGRTVRVIPLRIDLRRFACSRSQRRIFKGNRDLRVIFRDAAIDAEKERLFEVHKRRFKDNIPASLTDFLSPFPAVIPCPALETCLFLEGDLIATGYMDLGETAVSSVYTFFDTRLKKRGLGIYVLLRQILFSLESSRTYLYPGYAYREPSFYDYKKRFAGLEYFDWHGHWKPYKPEQFAPGAQEDEAHDPRAPMERGYG